MSVGGPAFPVTDVIVEGQVRPSDNGGMSLRDYFAAAALPALIEKMSGVQNNPKTIAEAAYAYADCMINSRK